jgi:hypothetical protein
MNFDRWVELFTAIGTVGAVVVAMIAISRSDRNSKKQIVVEKLEELFEIIQSLDMYYQRFSLLDDPVSQLLDQDNKKIQTFSDYFPIMDRVLPEGERRQLYLNLSRIEVLSKCYTNKDLQKQILECQNLMYSYANYVFNGGGRHLKALYYKDGFPNYGTFFLMLENLKTGIIAKIKLR